MSEPYKPTMRLACQFSIPVTEKKEAEDIYSDLKIFLLAFSPDITLQGQVLMMLEPCCQKQPEKKQGG